MDRDRFARRRKRFFDAMKDGVAVFRSWPVFPRNGDVDHPYRQDSDFQYLTGFEEHDSYAVFEKDGKRRTYTLFVLPSDPEMETWVGRRAGVEGAVRDHGADLAIPSPEFFDRLPALLSKRDRLYLQFGRDAEFEGRVLRVCESLKAEVRKGNHGPWEIIDPRSILWDMRLIKTPADLADLERACEITGEGFKAVMRAVKPGMREFELAAVLEFEFRRRGSPRVGFETICAAGANATTLHYIRNESKIRPDDMVLVDAGAEWNHLSADISRTFPASGRFTEAGRTVYEWVLKAQEACIEAIRPGVTYAEVLRTSQEVLTRGLVKMGVLNGRVKTLVDEGAFQPYYMHRIGHWLGADVHDVGPYFVGGESITLRPGMVLTVEPGLYFPDSPEVPEAYRGIGVRIEDDVLVVKGGRRILTAAVPKQPDEIEAFMADGNDWWKNVRPVTVKTGNRQR
jgi:Xaa-Pro aminopeptidase